MVISKITSISYIEVSNISVLNGETDTECYTDKLHAILKVIIKSNKWLSISNNLLDSYLCWHQITTSFSLLSIANFINFRRAY